MARAIPLGKVPFTGDLLHFHYPLRDFYARALAAGHRVEWMPSLHLGFDVAAEGQLGAYHPFHWLLYRVLPLDPAFMVEVVAAYPLLFAGMWRLLGRACPAPAAAFGAMLAAFSGFMLLHGVHPNMVTIVAHVPWLLLVVHGACREETWPGRLRQAGWLAVLTGSVLLLGHPQAAWFAALATLAGTLLASRVVPRAAWLRGGTAVLIGALVGVAIGSAQLLATAGALARAARGADDPEFATTFSLPLVHLWQLLHPYLFWGRLWRWNEDTGAGDEFGVYGGAVAIVLAVWWLAQAARPDGVTRRELRIVGWGLAAAIVVALWLGTGRYGKLYYLQTWLPVVGQFRAPVRYILFAQTGLAALAAFAMARLMARDRRLPDGAWSLAAPWALVVLSGASAVWLVSAGAGGGTVTPWVATSGPLLLAAAAAVLTLGVLGWRGAAPLLAVLAIADLAAYGLGGMVVWRDFLTRQQVVELLGPREQRPPAGDGRVAYGLLFPDMFVLDGYRFLRGYTGLVPARVLEYDTASELRVAGVRYAHRVFQEQAAVSGAEPYAREWFALPPPLPRARLVAEARVSRDPAADIARIDVESVALVERDLALDPGARGEAMETLDVPGEIRVRTLAAGRRLLVVSEAWDEGWVAEVAGQPAEVERVYGDFIGVVVPAGAHTARFSFDPAYRRVFAVAGSGGAVLALILIAAPMAARRSPVRWPH
ncbi:MAG: hypothetical protein FJW23_11290 [Acidimicrobiia bacterium]|nr:hypothetical protein [Acidimicrobiia bacterium]